MKEKVMVKICTGTLCYLMGGADLQLLEEHLTPEMIDRVEVSGSPCLDCCNHDSSAKAPFVMVGDRLISEANITKIVDAIREELNLVG